MSVHPAVRRSARWRAALSWLAAALDLAALGGSLLPLGATACSATSVAVTSAAGAPGQPAAPGAEICHAAPTIIAFQHAIPVLTLLIALGLVPLLTLRMRRRWPCVASAAVQTVLQLLSLGGFLFWTPAWLCTVAAALVPLGA